MKVLYKTLANPHLVFTLIWSFALFLYLFEWSDRFPPITTGLLVFLSVAIGLHLLLGSVAAKTNLFAYVPLSKPIIDLKDYLFIINLITWILNFAYSGVPLIKIMRGINIDYRLFGMPTVIVFAQSFNSFLCVYYFHVYLTTKNKKLFIYISISILYYLLIFSRGQIMMTGMSMFFMWMLSQTKAIRLRFVIFTVSIFLIVMYAFGVAGNIRTSQLIALNSGQAVNGYNNETILTIGAASQKFRNSIVPNEFFWSYIYIASPLSNLQYNVNNVPPTNYSVDDVAALGINEFTYDFISKRLNSLFHIEPKKPLLIVDELTVCTIFAESYCYLGWAGIILMLLFMLVFPIAYTFILGFNSEFVPMGCAILTSIYCFSFFDNMLVYSGLGLQLVYPYLLKVFNTSYHKTLIQHRQLT